MSLAVGFLVGAVLGACAVPLVRWLPRGIDERLEQPRWTRLAGHPATLVVAGALLGGLIAAGAPSWPALASGLVLLAVLLPATAIDVAWRVVPDSLVAFGFVVGLAVVALDDPALLGGHVLAALLGGTGATLLGLAARGGFGLGDAKLIAMLGAVLGAALPLALMAAAVVSGAVALPVLLLRGRGATVPLVPFLAVGAVVAVVCTGLPG